MGDGGPTPARRGSVGPLLLREPQFSLVPVSFLGARTVCWHQHGVWRFLDTRDQRLMHRAALTQRKCFSDAGGTTQGTRSTLTDRHNRYTDTHTQTDIQRCTQAHTTDAQADTQRSHRHMHRGTQTKIHPDTYMAGVHRDRHAHNGHTDTHRHPHAHRETGT